jgi:MtfA peptidase
MFFSSGRARRRQELVEAPFPREWREALTIYVRHFRYLNPEQQQRIEGCVQVMGAEKDWVGGSSFEVTDAMKAAIAGYAGVMTLGFDEPYYYDRLKSIIIYPQAYMPRASRYDVHAPMGPFEPRLGESWHHGPVVLSWAEIGGPSRRRPGNNLVIHEFAHHVDSLDGDTDGTPSIIGRQQRREWHEVVEEEFARLAADASRGEITLLDRYGASNRAEFFAVASECFFERPHAMRERHTALYRVLSNFYCQDPAVWLPDAGTPAANP